jgi:hypothetical protein
MATVTQRISQVKQPRGGYINPKDMAVRYLTGDAPAPVDHNLENIHASLVGMAVDYLTRLAIGAEPKEAFKISLFGARALGGKYLARALKDVGTLTPGKVDRAAIAVACKLSGYDVAYRVGPERFNPKSNTTPDETTIRHIGTMVDRSLNFFREYGPVLIDGFTMSGGYTAMVDAGDGDFITVDTLWDFKVSVAPPTNKHYVATSHVLAYGSAGRLALASALAGYSRRHREAN